MNILLFLTYWAVRVVEWFGSLYPNGREIIIHFVDYVSYYANQAIGGFASWVIGQINAVIGFVLSITSQIVNIAVNAAQQVAAWILSVVYQVRDWLLGQFYALQNYVVGLFNHAIALVNSVFPWVQNLIELAKAWIISYLFAQFGWIIQLYNFIMGLVSIFSPSNIQKFLDLIERIYPELLLFLANPIFYILDLIKDKFVSFLCAVLAYGLGTTKYELPPFAQWKNR